MPDLTMPRRQHCRWLLLLLLVSSAVSSAVGQFPYTPPAPTFFGPPAPPAPASSPAVAPASNGAPAPATGSLGPSQGPAPGFQLPGESPGDSPGEAPGYQVPSPTSPLAPNAEGPGLDVPAPGPSFEEPTPEAPSSPVSQAGEVKWCAVRDEFEDCKAYTDLLSTPDQSWTCVQRDNKAQCMDAIKHGAATLMSLEAGLAYVAFLNHSMKAVVAEEYTFHAQSYGAVAVVNKAMCDMNANLKWEDLKGLKSCHSEYLSAAGWNYPVQNLLKTVPVDSSVINMSMPNDQKVLTSFFSASCAPSELGHGGICSGCGVDNDNSTFCSSSNTDYTGEYGAFRCLMEEKGDVAFVRAKTPTLYSSDGLNQQLWSTKSVNEFMYLCPTGGCKPINDNYGNCKLGDVPSNVVMTANSLPEHTRQRIISTLLAANWTQALYTGRNWQNYVLSVSTQALFEVKQVTRQYLGVSAVAAQTVMDLESNKIQLNSTSSSLQTTVPSHYLRFTLATLTIGILGVFCGGF